MIVFILTVLILASWQSFCKLALLPLKVAGAAAILFMMLPFLFEEKIASSSMLNLKQILTDPANLENWCALIVIQELLTLVIGFSLLSDHSEEGIHGRIERESGLIQTLKKLKKLKYIIFLPSFLLPSGILYLQMYFFNRFTGMEFRKLSILVSLAVGISLLLTVIVLKLLRRDLRSRVLTVLHAEFCLLTAAIFLPVAAGAKLIPSTEFFDFRSPLYLIAGGVGITILFTIIFYCYRKKKERRFHVNRNTNT